MSATAPDEHRNETLARDAKRVRDTVASLGAAFRAADVDYPSPPLARATIAAENLYTQIDVEFGMLSSTEAGRRMGSRAQATRNLAVTARHEGRLLGLVRGRYVEFPGFQFDDNGARQVIADIIAVGKANERTETGLVQWLMTPTTYLDGQRPVEFIQQPDTLLQVANDAFGVQW